ncbi:hypothetical protein BDF19DRAFT_246793 [Syncephalis fuscata]|nr:hypothetical protein BDF19DRAFT_246793 [Syncephalis fuscata]
MAEYERHFHEQQQLLMIQEMQQAATGSHMPIDMLHEEAMTTMARALSSDAPAFRPMITNLVTSAMQRNGQNVAELVSEQMAFLNGSTEQVMSTMQMDIPAIHDSFEEDEVEIEEEITEQRAIHENDDDEVIEEELEIEEELVMIDSADIPFDDAMADQITRFLNAEESNHHHENNTMNGNDSIDTDGNITESDVEFSKSVQNNIWAALYAKEETRDEEEADAHLNTLQVPQERSSSRVSMTAELSAADRSTSRGSNRGSRLASENNSRTASPALETSHINAVCTCNTVLYNILLNNDDDDDSRDAPSVLKV